MAKWVRFEQGGKTGFGTLEGDSIAVHTGDMFAGSKPDGQTLKLSDVQLSTPDDALFLKVDLTSPVPKDGEARIRIYKVYEDAPSYFAKGDQLIFDRPLGIRRNVIVLPAGYELVGCSVPSIVSTQADGRVRVSMLNDRDDQLPVKITGRRLP